MRNCCRSSIALCPAWTACDETCPMVDADCGWFPRERDHPPLALDGPAVSIRRFGTRPLKLENLLSYKAFTPNGDAPGRCHEGAAEYHYLRRHRVWKNTLLNTLSSFIPMTSESSRSRTPRNCNFNKITWCVWKLDREHRRQGRGAGHRPGAQCPAMRPERIIIGECRGRKLWTCCRP